VAENAARDVEAAVEEDEDQRDGADAKRETVVLEGDPAAIPNIRKTSNAGMPRRPDTGLTSAAPSRSSPRAARTAAVVVGSMGSANVPESRRGEPRIEPGVRGWDRGAPDAAAS